jgi:hypothetical protein
VQEPYGKLEQWICVEDWQCYSKRSSDKLGRPKKSNSPRSTLRYVDAAFSKTSRSSQYSALSAELDFEGRHISSCLYFMDQDAATTSRARTMTFELFMDPDIRLNARLVALNIDSINGVKL